MVCISCGLEKDDIESGLCFDCWIDAVSVEEKPKPKERKITREEQEEYDRTYRELNSSGGS